MQLTITLHPDDTAAKKLTLIQNRINNVVLGHQITCMALYKDHKFLGDYTGARDENLKKADELVVDYEPFKN